MLHFKRNPEAIAVEALEQKKCSTLEAENAALRGQLQKLEQQSSSSAGGHTDAGSVDSALKEAQISVLQRQVTTQHTHLPKLSAPPMLLDKYKESSTATKVTSVCDKHCSWLAQLRN